MNCDRCREIAPAFFQQTLAEQLRFETCEHLSDCLECCKAAEESGQWAVEFLQLNHLTIPGDWLRHWESAAVSDKLAPERRQEEIKKTAAPKPLRNLNHIRHAWKFWLAGALLFLTSAFIVFKYSPPKNSPAPEIKKGALSALESDAMDELNEIARRLGIKLDPSGKPVHAQGEVIAPDVRIKPVHAHLKFSSEEQVAEFEKWVFSLKAEESFRMQSLWILSLDRAQLYAISQKIKNKQIKIEGGFPAPTQVPVFEGTMRVSFYIDRTFQSGEMLLLFQHWHFTFEFHNRFDLLERLKGAGVKILYETPELWVFEIQASQLEDVITRVNEVNGLKKEFINPEVLPDSGKIPIRISVHITEK